MVLRSTSSLLALLIVLTLPAFAQQPAPQIIDVSRLGPQVGQVVPDFRLQDAEGKAWTRDSIMGPRGAMLAFMRSADW
jgi:hypothetical protein